MEKMGNRYPASFYDQLLTGPIVRSPEEMVKAAEILAPLWPRYQTWKREKIKARRRKVAIWLFAVIGVILSFRVFPGFQWWVFAHLRIAVTVLPKWSGFRLTNNDCLIPNIPHALVSSLENGGDEDEEKGIDSDCWSCESVHGANRVAVSNAKAISQYAAWTKPMVVVFQNETKRSGFRTISDVMREIGKPYQQRFDAEPCHLVTNFPHSFHEFLIRFNEYQRQPWFAQWQNCDHDTTKTLRVLYKRPDFLPRSFSTMGASWIFLASNYDANVFREVETTEPWFWITQIAGTSRLQLKPKTKCQSICRDIDIDLNSGVIALIPTSIWSMGYMPIYEKGMDNIAYGVESYQETRL